MCSLATVAHNVLEKVENKPKRLMDLAKEIYRKNADLVN